MVRRDTDEGCEERHHALHARQVDHDPLEEMTQALSRSASQRLAADTRSEVDPVFRIAPDEDPLRRERDVLRAQLHARGWPRDTRHELARLGRQLDAARSELEDARAACSSPEANRHVSRPWRRRPSAEQQDREAAARLREELWARRCEELQAAQATALQHSVKSAGVVFGG